MAKEFHKDVNILPGSCDHSEAMEMTKRYFMKSHSLFMTDKDAAYFVGWLIANIYDADLLDSLHVGIESHMDHIKALKYDQDQVEQDNG